MYATIIYTYGYVFAMSLYVTWLLSDLTRFQPTDTITIQCITILTKRLF